MRLRTLPLTVACISLGGFLAAFEGLFSWPVLLLCLLTGILLQILSNLANDYGDAIHGADHDERQGPLREVQSGSITAGAMKNAIVITAVLSLLAGIGLLATAQLELKILLIFLLLGVICIFAAILYTNGTLPYGYIGLGDIAVYIFFGIVGAAGSAYLISGTFDWTYLLPASACGLLSVAVLNINNIRDISSDTLAGKRSIPVRIGRSRAVLYHKCLLLTAVGLAVAYVFVNYRHPYQFTFLLASPLLIWNARMVSQNTDAAALDGALRQMALSTLIFILLFGVAIQ